MVSGLLSRNGNEALIILSIHHGFLRPCFSDAIMREYEAVLARPKFGFQREELSALMEMVRVKGEIFAPETYAALSPDSADTKFLHCAMAANAHAKYKSPKAGRKYVLF